MLTEMRIKNFAIIDNLNIEFQEGLNIISGETGAGKSILLKSLSLLMGSKATNDMIRSGCDTATIEGAFDLNNRPDIQNKLQSLGVDCYDKALIVKRIISNNSKSKIYLNSSLSTLQDLNSIVYPLVEVTSDSAPLIELTGQHEAKSLLSKDYHMQILDRYSMTSHLLSEFEILFKDLKETRHKMEQMQLSSKEKESQLDFLKFQQSEILASNPKDYLEEDIESQYNKVKHLKKLNENLGHLEAKLWGDDGVLSLLQSVSNHLNEACDLDTNLISKKEILEQIISLSDELSFQLQNYKYSLNNEDIDLLSMEEKMSELKKLQKKYGPSLEDIITKLEQIEAEIHEIENKDDIIAQLNENHKSLIKKATVAAKKISKARLNGAHLLQASVNAELKDLNMKGFEFLVSIQPKEMNHNGMDEVEFMCKAGKNMQPRPLAKTASGGELSRILLSLKNVIGASDLARTYLFDEVDTGVSGETAQKVGKKLRQIAQGQQVICITHLPQVACYADHHFCIEKQSSKSSVSMQIRYLNKKDQIQEIARLISGEKISKTSLAHAKELLGNI